MRIGDGLGIGESEGNHLGEAEGKSPKKGESRGHQQPASLQRRLTGRASGPGVHGVIAMIVINSGVH